jgi:hypothetical protein
MRESPPLFLRLIFLLVLLACAASICIYWNRVPAALHAANIRTGLPQAKPLTDLYPRWYGTRELLLHHRDPYGTEVSREIQIAYYGRALDPSVATDRLDQERFAYPLYVIFFMLPTVFLEFDTVRIVAWWFLAGVATATVWFWLRFQRIRISVFAGIAIFAVALTNLPVLQGLSLLQLGLLVAAFVAAAAVCAADGHLLLAGLLLALATIKPQMCVLPIAWFAIWCFGGWKQRKSLLWGFGGMMAALILTSEFLLPKWLIEYPSAVAAYSEYTHATSFLSTLLPSSMCWPVSILAGLGFGAFCWRVRHEPADSVWFAVALVFALTLTVTVLPTVNASFNQVLLLPAALLGIRHWKELTQGNRVSRLVFYMVSGFAFLPWVLALAVLVARPDPQNGWYLPMWSASVYFSFGLPVTALVFLILLCRAVASNSGVCLDGTRFAAGGTVQEHVGVDSIRQ